MHMIRKTFRLMFRLGLLAGLGLALFKFVQGRRSADYGRPSTDWAPAPAPAVNPNLPKSPPDPPLVEPAMLEEVIEKRKTVEPAAPAPAGQSTPAAAVGESVVKKAPAKKKAAAKTAPAAEPAADGPVKKVAPPKKAAAKKAAAPADAAVNKAPAAKKAAPAKKAAKKQPPPPE